MKVAVWLILCLFSVIQAGSFHAYAQDSISHESKHIAPPSKSYVLGAGDRIRINVFGESELSGMYIISGEGIISFPLIGEVKASGLAIQALENAIEEKLRDGYLKSPSVSIEVDEHRPFYIMGEVRNPGSYDYAANMTILKAVALAGGFTYRANENQAEVLRLKEGNMQSIGELDVKASAQPGDIIVIKERFF